MVTPVEDPNSKTVASAGRRTSTAPLRPELASELDWEEGLELESGRDSAFLLHHDRSPIFWMVGLQKEKGRLMIGFSACTKWGRTKKTKRYGADFGLSLVGRSQVGFLSPQPIPCLFWARLNSQSLMWALVGLLFLVACICISKCFYLYLFSFTNIYIFY